jgi:HK97 gp10 family phage protein
MPIQIEGLADLSNMLAEMSPRAAKRWLLRAAEPAARVVLDAMHETVPVDVGVLEEAGTWEKEWETGDEAVLTISIGPKKGFFWGSLQEWGTHTNPAQHWLGRAWESCKNKCLGVFSTEAIGILQDLENRRSD